MDDQDLSIVRALLRDPLAPVAQLARRTGLGDSATRARVRRLRDDGTLGRTAAVPNARLFGQRYIVGLYRDIDWRETFEVPSVVGCSVNHEGVIAPTCLTGGEWPADVAERYGEPERTFVQADPPLQPPGDVLSDLQWRVLTAFVADPHATDRALGQATALSARTVKRHRDAFVRGNHVRLETNLRSLRGDHVLFHLYVQGEGSHGDHVRQHLSRSLGGAWPQQVLDVPKGVLFFCTAPSLADAAGAPALAMGLDDVEHAELVVSVDGTYHTERLVAACERARALQRNASRAMDASGDASR